MLFTSYHNHTTWSDGAASIPEMMQAGKDAGLQEFGLSDHWVLPPSSGYDSESWSMLTDRLEQYVNECLHWKNRLDDEHFTIRIGLEVDYFEENWKENLQLLDPFPFDYLIGAVHYAGKFPIDHSAAPWQALTQAEIDAVWCEYWRKVCGLAASRKFDFLAHLDLPKKFGFLATDHSLAAWEQTLLTLQEYDLPLEINTAGWAKPCAEAYPSASVLTRANELGIPVLVNADAHQKNHIMRFYPQAEELLRQCGYQQVCTFAGRQRKMISV
ncbi:MAG: histidinol-phosphatase [Lentisphaeria bacterium]